jgi:hypothetical protein
MREVRAALCLKSPVSFTPGFSPVERALTLVNRFNGFYRETKGKPLKRFQLLLHFGHRAKSPV